MAEALGRRALSLLPDFALVDRAALLLTADRDDREAEEPATTLRLRGGADPGDALVFFATVLDDFLLAFFRAAMAQTLQTQDASSPAQILNAGARRPIVNAVDPQAQRFEEQNNRLRDPKAPLTKPLAQISRRIKDDRALALTRDPAAQFLGEPSLPGGLSDLADDDDGRRNRCVDFRMSARGTGAPEPGGRAPQPPTEGPPPTRRARASATREVRADLASLRAFRGAVRLAGERASPSGYSLATGAARQDGALRPLRLGSGRSFVSGIDERDADRVRAEPDPLDPVRSERAKSIVDLKFEFFRQANQFIAGQFCSG
ncbi:MAG: hypothetical protein ABR878_00060 [Roseiarcus sp.]